jgi:hypothetical protein
VVLGGLYLDHPSDFAASHWEWLTIGNRQDLGPSAACGALLLPLRIGRRIGGLVSVFETVMPLAMNDLEKNGNLIEAVLWFAFTVVFVFKAWQADKRWRRLFGTLAGAFLVFSVSDVIESRTGAWWRPLWLLLMKGACLGVFLWGIWAYRRLKKSDGA